MADQAVWLRIDPETSGETLARYAIAKGRKGYVTSLPPDSKILRGFDREFNRADGKAHIDPDQRGLDTVLLGTGDVEDLERWKAAIALGVPLIRVGPITPVLPEGEVWTLRLQPDLASLPEEGRASAERYQKRFGAPPDDDAILGADAIALIADGSRTVGGDDRAKLAKELAGRSEFAGLTGPIVRKDGRTNRPMWVERIVKGKRVVEAVPE